MTKQRTFPYEFEQTKELKFYPQKVDHLASDILEIGPGRGDLLLELAKENPHKTFIAVELGKKRFAKLIERIQKREFKNILLIGGNARIILPLYAREETFKTIYVLFPDPWPKKKHTFKRLLSLEFLWLLTHFLKKNGFLVIATDDPQYANWIKENLDQIPLLTNTLYPNPYTLELPELPKTFFQQKWKKMGRGLYFFKFCKKPF